MYQVTSYGADPTGKEDSTDAIMKAITDALNGPSDGFLFSGIHNLGGARVDLEGGSYVISRPLQFPVAGRGNLMVRPPSILIRMNVGVRKRKHWCKVVTEFQIGRLSRK